MAQFYLGLIIVSVHGSFADVSRNIHGAQTAFSLDALTSNSEQIELPPQ